MDAILWDGQKQLKGKLTFDEKELKFNLVDFPNTDLDFDVRYSNIKEVNYHSVFDLVNKGIEIVTVAHKSNVFIVEDPIEVKTEIEKKIFDLSKE